MSKAPPMSRLKMKNRLWVLSEVYYPEETGTGYYITLIAEHLAALRPVCVLCAQPAYSRAGVTAPRYEERKSVQIFRCLSLVLHQRPSWARLLRMIWITSSMFFAALFRIRRDESILAVTNPPSVPMMTALLSLFLRVPYSLVVHDVYPDMLSACGIVSHKALSYRLLQKINRIVLRHADHIFCIGRDMAEHLTKSRGIASDDDIQAIPLWSDCDIIHPQPRHENALLCELGLNDKFVVLYAGNMGYPHGINSLVGVIKTLEKYETIHFLFIGSGPKQKLLYELVQSGYKNLTLLPPRPRKSQNEFLNACDVAILSLVTGMQGLAVPSRTYNLLAAGKPMIALISESSEVARVIREERVGWVVEPGAVEKAAQAILDAKENTIALAEMGVRARRAAETKYDRTRILRKYDQFFSPCASPLTSSHD
jgi:colanic acid biosynthesis glycosyl transferase WcaI